MFLWGVDEIYIYGKLPENFGCYRNQIPKACEQHNTFIVCLIFTKSTYIVDITKHLEQVEKQARSDDFYQTYNYCLHLP